MRFYWNLKIKYYVFLFLFVQCSNLTNVLGNVCPEYNFRGSVLQRNRNAKCYSCPRVYYSNETFKCTFVFNFFLYLLISVYRLFVVRVGSKIFRLVPIKKKIPACTVYKWNQMILFPFCWKIHYKKSSLNVEVTFFNYQFFILS